MKKLEFSSIVEASLSDVWDAWTTSAGVIGFFAPEANIELEIGGAYELYFDPSAGTGNRGTEGMRVQTYIPERILAIDWCNPPEFASIRSEKTWVVIEFSELDDELCEIHLTHVGWQDGADWDAAYQYFQNAWALVMYRFERYMRMGAVDWESIASVS